MEVRNCRSCGRLFNYLSGPNICPVCREEVEKKFGAVKDYIRENPSSNISEIAEANEVSVNQIKQWIREERLQFADDSPIGIECEVCGTTIKTGKYCQACKEKLATAFSDFGAKSGAGTAKSQSGPRDNKSKMRFI